MAQMGGLPPSSRGPRDHGSLPSWLYSKRRDRMDSRRGWTALKATSVTRRVCLLRDFGASQQVRWGCQRETKARLLPILLDTGRTEPGEPSGVNRIYRLYRARRDWPCASAEVAVRR